MTAPTRKLTESTPGDDAPIAVGRLARQIWEDEKGREGKPDGTTRQEAYSRFNAGERPKWKPPADALPGETFREYFMRKWDEDDAARGKNTAA